MQEKTLSDLKQLLEVVVKFIPLLVFIIAIYVVHNELSGHQFHDIIDSFWKVSPILLGIAFLITIFDYAALTVYDFLALKYTNNNQVPFGKIAFTSFISFALSNSTGHAWVSGGSVRFRYYNPYGVQGWDIAKISLFLALTYIVGVMSVGFAGTISIPQEFNDQNPTLFQGINILTGLFMAVYIGIAAFWKKGIKIGDVELNMPEFRIVVMQIIIAFIDIVLASLVMWVFVKDIPGMSYQIFVSTYVTAQVLGLISQVPGGLGIFESSFLWLAGPMFKEYHPDIVAALVLYRSIYYFVPLIMAGVMLLVNDLKEYKPAIVRAGKIIGNIVPFTVPQLFSILLFINGGMLLASGTMPTATWGTEWLEDLVPLPVVEFSHMSGSLIGVLLFFLARAVRLRLDAAWFISMLLLAMASVFSMLKGVDWQSAVFSIIMLAAIASSRRYFYRKTPISKLYLSPAWMATTLMVIVVSIWLGFFSYQHVEYSTDLWWKFSYSADASRFLRLLVAVSVLLASIAIYRLLSPARPVRVVSTDEVNPDELMPIIRNDNSTAAYLSLLGDKNIYWSSDRKSFLSYATTSKYWVVWSDPVGDPQSFEQLLWAFCEEADRFGAKVVFYEIGEKYLPLYLNLGLIFLKLGQEAQIPLQKFTLEGKKCEHLRKGRNRLLKDGHTFEALSTEKVKENIDRLKEISDAWLARKSGQEKGFSMGFFDEKYISMTRVAVARNKDGRIMAFANILDTDCKEEISVDLMRYDPQSHNSIMDFLFAEILLLGQAEGYRWFNFGMAPLSGLERHYLAPLWHKIGSIIYDFGEEFYNFSGLYEYKAKYDPVWRQKYLALQSSMSAPIVLLAITKLISSGYRKSARHRAKKEEI